MWVDFMKEKLETLMKFKHFRENIGKGSWVQNSIFAY